MLIPIDNVLDKNTVATFRQHLEQTEWEDGARTAGGQAIHVKANRQIPSDSDTGQQLGRHILQVLGQHPVFLSAALPKKIFPPKFNCYQDSGRYGLHVDNAIMYLPNNDAMRTDISCTLFLSEPDEYHGGELCIETRYGAQEVKLQAGDMILYPSTSLHEVKPVTAGARISCFFWVESMVRDSQQRETLFELDQSIQALTLDRGADDPEVRRLSGIYHNLVRGWSET